MLRYATATVLLVMLSMFASAAPPEAPAKLAVKVGVPVTFTVKVPEGKKFSYAPGFDASKCTVVRLFTDDTTTASFLAIANEPGVFYVTFWTRDEKEAGYSQLVIETSGGVAPPPKPVDPPPVPTTKLFFVVVGGDGPASPAVETALRLPEWDTLKAKGHSYLYKTATEAVALKIKLPAGTALPCVVTLRVKADGKSEQLTPVQPFPTTGAGVLALPDAHK